MRLFTTALCAGLALGGISSAQFTLSKLFFNPSGNDGGQEAIEIRGPASTSLAGYWFLAIEGDSVNVMGILDVRTDLGAMSTGPNGLCVIRDAASAILPGTDAANALTFVNDWNPDLENGSNTYILGTGTPPAATTDLDVDNDGNIDAGALAGFTVVDAIGVLEGSATPAVDFAYGDDVGFANLPQFLTPTPWTPGALIRYYNADGSACGWAGGVVVGTNPGGPYNFSTTGLVFGFAEQGVTTTPDIDLGTVTAVVDTDGDGVANGCDGCPTDPAKSAPGLCGCGIPEGCSLGATPQTISISAGGTQTLSLFGGAPNAGQLYFVLGSVSGTTPGIPVDSVLLPLNFDAYFAATLTPNTPLLAPSLSFLNGSGNGTCSFNIPAATVIGGVPFTAHHAYVVFNLGLGVVTFASNAAPVTLVP
jgi:hypothetical protein